MSTSLCVRIAKGSSKWLHPAGSSPLTDCTCEVGLHRHRTAPTPLVRYQTRCCYRILSLSATSASAIVFASLDRQLAGSSVFRHSICHRYYSSSQQLCCSLSPHLRSTARRNQSMSIYTNEPFTTHQYSSMDPSSVWERPHKIKVFGHRCHKTILHSHHTATVVTTVL